MALPKSASGLELQAIPTEDWQCDAEVQKVLARLLDQPWGDHEQLVHELLRGMLLSDVHLHGLVAFVKSDAASELLAPHGRSRAFALHCWLHHL